MAGYGDVSRLLAAVERALVTREGSAAEPSELTESELGVLRDLADGAIPKEIADRTGRSVNTIRVHIANAIAKLGCHGKAEAVQLARRRGLI